MDAHKDLWYGVIFINDQTTSLCNLVKCTGIENIQKALRLQIVELLGLLENLISDSSNIYTEGNLPREQHKVLLTK